MIRWWLARRKHRRMIRAAYGDIWLLWMMFFIKYSRSDPVLVADRRRFFRLAKGDYAS